MPFYEYEILFMVVFLIVLFVPIIIYLKKDKTKHIPRAKLSIQQKNNLLQNGLIHFTTRECAHLIYGQKTIKSNLEVPMYKEEKNMIWFFPVPSKLDTDYIDLCYNKIKRKRPKVEVCIHVEGIKESESKSFIYQPNDDYIVHNGDLTKKMTIYILSNGTWNIVDSIEDC